MGFLGLDILAIRHLARQLEAQSREVEVAAREMSSLIADTDWFGLDSRRFSEAWNAHRAPELRYASRLLADAAQLAHRGATNQENVSRS